MSNNIPSQNGLSKWVRWLVASLWSIIVAALLLLANNVIANDKKSTDGDKEVTNAFQQADKELREKIDANQEKNDNKLTTLLVQQTKILTILEKQ